MSQDTPNRSWQPSQSPSQTLPPQWQPPPSQPLPYSPYAQPLPYSPYAQPSPQYPYPQPVRQAEHPPMPPAPAPKKKSHKKLWIGLIVAVIVLGIIISAMNHGGSPTPTPTKQATQAPTQASQPTAQPTPVPTQAATATPVPTVSAAELEATYKAITTNTTIATLDKDGNADYGKDVHFTCTILNFVKDSSGNTAGANVDDPNTTGVVQIAFPSGTDLSQLNTGDTLEVWGTDGGTASGQNAFGATIQEVVLSANYMTNQTTGYHTQ